MYLRVVQERALADAIEYPVLFLSSNAACWEHLAAEVVLEPTELHGWKRPMTRDVRLMLFAGGPLRFDPGRSERSASIVREGDFILRPGVEPYEVGWKSLSSAPTRTFVLHLDRDLLLRTAEELELPNASRLALASRVGFRDPMLKEICLTLWRELERPAAVWKIYMQTVVQMLAVHLLRHYATAPIQTRESAHLLTSRQLRAVTDLVLGNLGEDLPLKALAKQAGLSPYYFARLFRATTGASPHQFILARRLETAQRLLRETKETLADVALETGFASQSHLTRMFRRWFGLTPRAYRQRT